MYGGGSTGNNGAACYSNTLGKEMPDNVWVQRKLDNLWYQCANASRVDRGTDPDPCNGDHQPNRLAAAWRTLDTRS